MTRHAANIYTACLTQPMHMRIHDPNMVLNIRNTFTASLHQSVQACFIIHTIRTNVRKERTPACIAESKLMLWACAKYKHVHSSNGEATSTP